MDVVTARDIDVPAYMPHAMPYALPRSLPSNPVDVDRPDRNLRQQFGPSPLTVLTLNKELLLDNCCRRMTFKLIEAIMRIVPAVWMYGGTIGLVVCVVFRYRWGVLFALTLFSGWSAFSLFLVSFNGIRAMLQLWANENTNWQQMWRNEMQQNIRKVTSNTELAATGLLERTTLKRNTSSSNFDAEDYTDVQEHDSSRSCSGDGVVFAKYDFENPQWNDIFHVVIIASYCTPEDALVNTIEVLARFSDARTNMGIVLAFEQREKDVYEKAASMKFRFSEMFFFVSATFHPSNLPNHIKGKASNMCWAFQELTSKILHERGFCDEDLYRILVTNMDDDSEFHDNYFDALTYHFLKTDLKDRYLTMWQPPVAHFKNITTQPALVRFGSISGSIADLGRHVNSLDCHTLFSSNSCSLVLTLAVGGYDPDWVSDDWHMLAKCSVMTEGRCRCQSIMLPMINLMPEEDSYCGTLRARWTQVKRHAIGISEVVFLVTSLYLAVLECPTWGRAFRVLWRTAPLVSKFIEVHLMSSLYGVWPPFAMLSQFFSSLWFGSDLAKDQLMFNSVLAHIQQRTTTILLVMLVATTVVASMYVNFLKHRISNNQDCFLRYPILFWIRSLLDMTFLGVLQQILFGSIPEWVAAGRIIFQLKIDHAVAAMIGRPDMGEGF
eukprot:CAMPEP_0169239338 /NCGR_PEP_ID=MMETSP1016-20121227/30848_1 /TAXON_ID=342587 /ORGANISM="Karlodinium micrum, Strain CCMP2283" /LENGTH=663 /DNA_ID=CAMNT_0009319245 /DNA_START=52 /DNA_END=2043 /DNA_ORIENTATION=-